MCLNSEDVEADGCSLDFQGLLGLQNSPCPVERFDLIISYQQIVQGEGHVCQSVHSCLSVSVTPSIASTSYIFFNGKTIHPKLVRGVIFVSSEAC